MPPAPKIKRRHSTRAETIVVELGDGFRARWMNDAARVKFPNQREVRIPCTRAEFRQAVTATMEFEEPRLDMVMEIDRKALVAEKSHPDQRLLEKYYPWFQMMVAMDAPTDFDDEDDDDDE